MNPGPRSFLLNYGRACLLVVLATGATWLLRPLLTVTPFCLLIFGVAITALFSGFRPAIFATLLSAGVIVVLFMPRGAGSFLGPANLLSLLSFAGLCLLMSRVATNQRASRNVAEASEYQLRQVIDSMNEIFLAVDNEWRFVHVNRLFEERTRRPVGDLIGKCLWDEFPELRGTIYQASYERARESGEAVRFDTPHRDGIRWDHVRVFPTAQGLSVFVSDITETKGHEREREEFESRFRFMADHAPVLIWMSDETSRCVWFNKIWLEFTGRTQTQEFGLGWAEGVHPDDLERCVGHYTEHFDARLSFEMEYRLRRADGEYRWILDSGVPRYSPESEFAGFIGSCIDITERRNLEQERAQLLLQERVARVEVERVSRMKDEFLATLSHELRTPLNAILGWSELVRDGKLSSSETEQGIATIQRNGRLQLQLIEDLLDMSRIISGKMRLDMGPVQAAPIVESTLASVRPAAQARDIQLTLSDQSEGAVVQGDAARLQQVVWNLLSNAIKFTDPGGRVHVLLHIAVAGLRIEVRDTGQGIRADFLPMVFEAFQQADSSTTRRHGGLGLGLGLVRQLVELHGGTVGATSPGPGQGSTFSLTLPLRVGSLPATRAGDLPLPAGPQGRQTNLDGVKALVVDDEVDARELIRLVLRDRQSVVCSASSAAEALELMKHDIFDVVITDIGMPGTDGFELLRHIRTSVGPNPSGIKVMALTAYAGDSDREAANRAGFDMHLAKPVDPNSLIDAVAMVLNRPVL